MIDTFIAVKMSSISVVSESFTNNYKPEALDFIFLVSVFCGIFVIISKNPIVSVLFLIGLFLSIASYLIFLGLSFIGLSYLLVYVGAVSILFLFILMLINVRISELLSDTSNSIPLAIIIAFSFNYPVHEVLPYNFVIIRFYYLYLNNTLNNISYLFSSSFITELFNFLTFSNESAEIAFVTSKIWDGSLAETTHIATIGNIMYTSYSI